MTELDESTLAVLAARARALSRRERACVRTALGDPIAVLSIGGETMGVPVSYLQSIIRLPPLTSVPHLPDWMPGIVQVRGTVICVVDIARRLGLPRHSESPYLAVLEIGHFLLGMLVDAVAGVREIFTDELVEQVTAGSEKVAIPVRFMTRDLVAVLDIESVFALADKRKSRGLSTPAINSGAQR